MSEPAAGRIYVYCRASRARNEDSPDIQWEAATQYLAGRGLGAAAEKFVDPDTSGSVPLGEREAGRVMMSRLRKGDHVVLAKLDRGFRSLRDACQTLEEFKRLGVHLHVVNLFGGSLDLNSPIGVFVFQILAAFAELERKMISERLVAGMMHARATRDIPAGPFQWGFKHLLVGTFTAPKTGAVKRMWKKVVDEPQREGLKMIWDMRESGMTYDAIRQTLVYKVKLVIPGSKTRNWDDASIRGCLVAYAKVLDHDKRAAEAAAEAAGAKEKKLDEQRRREAKRQQARDGEVRVDPTQS